MERSGRLDRAGAGSEVVVCAGAIGSPRLLLLSDSAPLYLRPLGIDVAVDLPGVGENLHDHLLSPVIFAAHRRIEPPTPGLSPIQTHLWWRSRPGLRGPDTQPIHFSVPLYEDWMEGPANAFTLMGGMVAPHSRGTVRLSGPDPGDALVIDPRILSEPEDLSACCVAGPGARHGRRGGPGGVGRTGALPRAAGPDRRRSWATTCAARRSATTTRSARAGWAPTYWRSSTPGFAFTGCHGSGWPTPR